jgi:hypothetical protein
VNIFFLDKDPYVAASMLCDHHIGKMQLETAQMLSTACRILLTVGQIGDTRLYKSTHAQHPSSVWIRQTVGNLLWISKYVDGMGQEWLSRKPGRPVHASYYVARSAAVLLMDNVDNDLAANRSLSPVPLCMPEQYWPGTYRLVDIASAVQAYRKYYLAEKSSIAKWPVGKVPYWWETSYDQ